MLDLQPGVDLEEGDGAVLADEELAGAGARRSPPRAGSPWTPRTARRSAPADRNGAGASSTSFWWRRCSEQSRVETTTTLPCASARHWVSTCRGWSRYRSTKHSPRPNAATASRTADSYSSGISSSVRATLRPAAAAAERGLDRDRQAVLVAANAITSSAPADRVGRAGGQRRADLGLAMCRALDLVAERLDGGRRRADPGQPGVDDRLREVGVLGQEAVAGVHRVGAGLARPP